MKPFAAALLALLPLCAQAQPAPGQATGPARTITREQFVQRASEIAGRRFDAIDTAHSGVVTRDQIRAFRQAHGALGSQPNQ